MVRGSSEGRYIVCYMLLSAAAALSARIRGALVVARLLDTLLAFPKQTRAAHSNDMRGTHQHDRCVSDILSICAKCMRCSVSLTALKDHPQSPTWQHFWQSKEKLQSGIPLNFSNKLNSTNKICILFQQNCVVAVCFSTYVCIVLCVLWVFAF